MNIYSTIESLSQAPPQSALTLGVFDGCHRGHKELLNKTLTIARQAGVPAGVFTFSSHPDLILNPNRPLRLVMSPEHRLQAFEEMGFDFSAMIPFDTQLRHTSAERFIHHFLIEQLKISHLVLGYDSHFGANRRGNAALALSELSPSNIGVTEVAAQTLGDPISSSRLRAVIAEGNLELAEQLLGEPYTILGRVGHGEQRGREIGFPTANIIPGFEPPLPPGVWATIATLEDGRRYKAGVDWGIRPTFAGETPSLPRLEAHLLDFNEDLYGQRLKLEFHAYIRPEKAFSSSEELAQQLHQDMISVTKALSA